MINIGDIETAVKLVSGVVSAVSGGLSISSWIAKNLKSDVGGQLRADLEKINAAEFDGWITVDSWTPESLGVLPGEECAASTGYMICVYHDELDDLDRIELREPGPWRADGVDRLRKVLGIDLR